MDANKSSSGRGGWRKLLSGKGRKEVVPGYVEGFNILDSYVTDPPSAQAAVQLFKGEWSCALPGTFAVNTGGSVPAFQDPRVNWALDVLGGVTGQRALELGPLEAGHTYMLEKAGAESILSIEANQRAYLKCLIAKEITGMHKARFLLGDFNAYMRDTTETYDVCFASGVLYHMLNPAETLQLIAKVASRVFIWSHYYDAKLLEGMPAIKATMGAVKKISHQGYEHELCDHYYKEFLSVPSFCGGPNPQSRWMTRDGMLEGLKYYGFKKVTVGLEQPNHPGGPAFCVVAQK